VRGLGATWEDWIALSTGARVSTRHEIGPKTLRMEEVAGAATLEALTGGDDPFAPLVAAQAQARGRPDAGGAESRPAAPASAPAAP
jgi:hypothetical protein